MKTGIRKGKEPKGNKKSIIPLAMAITQIVGIGLVAGGALIAGTDKVMKKVTGKKEEVIEAPEEEETVDY